MTRRDPVVHWSAVLLVCGAIGLSGCGAGRPPTAELAQATLAVQEASKSEAPQYAPADLNMARQELESGQQAMREKDYTKARRLANAPWSMLNWRRQRQKRSRRAKRP